MRYELIAVSRKAVYQARITVGQGLIARDQLLSYPVTLHFDDALLKRGYELAEEFNRPTAYDAQYLALAERLDVGTLYICILKDSLKQRRFEDCWVVMQCS